ncbi:MAG: SAM-dependent methyltransferase, partial [Dermabacter sp.]|nr:SAM-dependent methyltransferase [Dermabacter sp.]
MSSSGLSQLLTPEGMALLDSLPEYSEEGSLALSQRLRGEGHSPELIAAALTQSRLRTKARDKFGDFASSMLFTAHGLEQATRLEVAAHHAARFRDAQ